MFNKKNYFKSLALLLGQTSYVGQSKCEEVAGQVMDMSGLLEMDCSNVEFESGGLYVGQKGKWVSRLLQF